MQTFEGNIGLVIGRELVSMRGMNELRFPHKIKVQKIS